MRRALLLGSLLGLLGADSARAQVPWVSGGTDAKECAWPPVHFMAVKPLLEPGEGACTGTLIHPRVVLYAAHCGKPLGLRFSNTAINKRGRRLAQDAVEKHAVNPKFRQAADVHVDWAVAVLKEAITDTPIIPIASGCELEMLQKRGAEVILAGGSPNDQKDAEAFKIRWGKNRISSMSGGVLGIGAGNPSACKGDSGGPLLAQVPDGSWRTLGIASTKTGQCGGPGTTNNYARINAQMIAWIIEQTGINVSPCFKPDGTATPSKACDAFMAYAGDPSNPKGSYDNYCADAKVEPVRNACGVPKSDDAGDDEESSTSGEPDDSTEDSSSSTGKSGETEDESSDSTQDSSSDEEETQESDTDNKSGDESTEDEDDESGEQDSSGKDPEQEEDSAASESAGGDASPKPEPSPKSGGCSTMGRGPGFGSSVLLGFLLLGLRRRY